MKLQPIIESLDTKYFRCFEDVFVRFHPELNVIIGVNGAGKTALLEVTAGLLQPLVSQLRSEGAGTIDGFDEKDIKNDRIEAINTVWAKFIVHVNDEEYQMPLSTNEEVLSWYGTLNKEGYDVESIEEDEESADDIRTGEEFELSFLGKIVKEINKRLKDNSPVGLPVLAYYSCETADNKDNQVIKQNGTFNNPFLIYNDALSNRQSFNYNEFARWYKWQELVAKESGNKKLIETIEAAILQVISSEHSKFEHLHTRYFNNPDGELILSKNGLDVLVDQLSSGERMLFGLVGDLARRLVLANPGYDDPLKGYGIVLIDEIDLHLHPRWQRFILFNLRKIFPNIQFIVTTHSPQVLQYVKPEHIILLDNSKVIDDIKIRTTGKDSDLILTEAFFVDRYSEEIPEIYEIRSKVRQCFRLIDDDQFDKAKILIKELEDILGKDDPDLVELRTFLSLSLV